jgi:hypothetical protein
MAGPNVPELRPQFDALYYAGDFIGFRTFRENNTCWCNRIFLNPAMAPLGE